MTNTKNNTALNGLSQIAMVLRRYHITSADMLAAQLAKAQHQRDGITTVLQQFGITSPDELATMLQLAATANTIINQSYQTWQALTKDYADTALLTADSSLAIKAALAKPKAPADNNDTDE